jgi:hypothetical protein
MLQRDGSLERMMMQREMCYFEDVERDGSL